MRRFGRKNLHDFTKNGCFSKLINLKGIRYIASLTYHWLVNMIIKSRFNKHSLTIIMILIPDVLHSKVLTYSTDLRHWFKATSLITVLLSHRSPSPCTSTASELSSPFLFFFYSTTLHKNQPARCNAWHVSNPICRSLTCNKLLCPRQGSNSPHVPVRNARTRFTNSSVWPALHVSCDRKI